MDPRDLLRLEELCIQDCAPWCQATCPLHVDARAMTAAMAGGDLSAAVAIYVKRAPFPGILSRVCDQPCREVCKRREAGEAIAIGLLERACADHAGFVPEPVKSGPRAAGRVAVVGGGLSGALDLLEPQITSRLAERAHLIGECPVVVSSLGLHAGAVGAALWEKEEW